jgi:hypothetical protein
LDDILKEIRAIPGFADFLLSPSESKLVALAKSGGGYEEHAEDYG